MTDAARPAPTRMTGRADASVTSSIDLSKRDLTLDLARVVCVLLVVVIHLLMVGVGLDASGGIVVSEPLQDAWWFAPATWAGQIMPLFFVVGGFASLTAWRSLRRRGGTEADYVRTRVLRLAQPALPLFVFYLVVIQAARLLGVDARLLDTVIVGAGLPLWFLAAYILCQSLVPAMARLHARAPVATPLLLLTGVVATDAARYTSGVAEVGLLNLLFVWPLIQLIGFWYADGLFARIPRWALVVAAAASYALLVPLTSAGWYSDDMLANLNPPTLTLVVLAIAQTCVLRLIRPALAALMRTHAARAAVFLVGSRLMTVYLWHLPVIIALSGVALLIPGASPPPGSGAWWATRPVFFVAVMAAVFALSFLVARWEAPREVGPAPSLALVRVGALLAFVPPFTVMQWYLDFQLAVLGTVLLTVAVLVLGRAGGWRERRPVGSAG